MPLVPADHLDAMLSMVSVYALHIGATLLALLIAAWRVQTAKRRATRAETRAVLHGRVELADGAKRAVRIVVSQDGTTSRDFITWIESQRSIHAEPFYLIADGKRIRVEPGEDVVLVGEPQHTESVSARERRRIAEVAVDDHIYVEGDTVHAVDPELAQGYRGGGNKVEVMRPRLLSHEPLGAPLRAAAKREGQWLVAITLMLALFVALDSGYFARALIGERDHGVIDRVDDGVAVVTLTGGVITGRVDLHRGLLRKGTRVKVTRVPGVDTFGQLGHENRVPIAWLVLWLVSAVVVFGGYGLVALVWKPWYRGRRLIETEARRR